MGHAPAALFGYSHLTGGIPGGQAEYLRVPYADIGPIKIPDHLPDEKVLFLSDIFPTGWMAAESCDIKKDETVAVWGCGPVGQFALQSAWLMGAKRVIAIDDVPERLEMAKTHGKSEIVDRSQGDVYEQLMEMTSGRGPDKCIDAVGAEAHSTSLLKDTIDGVRQVLNMPANRPYVVNEAIKSCRKAGIISIPGVYTDTVAGFQLGPAMNKGLTFRMGQTHVQKYLPRLLKMIEEKQVDPSFVITHTVPLSEAPNAYDMFNDKRDECIKVVLKPW